MHKQIIKELNKKCIEDKTINRMAFLDLVGALELFNGITIQENFLQSLHNMLPVLSFSAVIFFSIVRYNQLKDKYKYIEENIDKYEELKKLYDEYITLLANQISKYEFDNNLELCIFLDELLKNGYFSCTDSLVYKRFNNIKEHHEDLIGTYVITGEGVCRHNTMFIHNLLDKLNISNLSICCYPLGTKKPKLRGNFATHILNCLLDGNNKFAYDFTNHFIGIIEDDNTISFKDYLNDKIVEYYSIVRKYNIDEYMSHPTLDIDGEDYVNAYIKSFYKFCMCRDDFSKLKKDNTELMNDISEKSLILLPRS